MPCTTITVVGQARLEVTSVSVSPQKPQYTVGETISVIATVSNTGTAPGTGTVVLTVNNRVVSQQSVTVQPNSSTNVTFSLRLETTGTMTICCDLAQ